MNNEKLISKKEIRIRWGICRNTLRKWLQDPDCLEELKETGYKPTQKLFTLKQWEIIKKYFE